jgi:acyl transferase domain-containing protein
MTDALDHDAVIAVIGMAGRFPQAPDVDAFWTACRDGIGCISRWDGRKDKGRVLAGGLVAGQDLFDPEAFGISPAEAEILDPQHRIFLELCWHGLEHASVVPDKAIPVSVYAAAAPSQYYPAEAESDSENVRYQRMIANGPDYLATRISYHLDLRGEAVNVQTACSSSLVAVHLACLSLQTGRSDVALAGGVSINPEQERGYAYEPGMIASSDGRCLPFDADARGAVPGNGAAVVVLQRLSDALAQRRRVYAVIRATAINNDGRAKSSFMAPNVEGQSEVIATALATAGVPAESIQYLEAHGTGTRLGDSIEIEAARTAFRYFTDRRAFCALGSLKANFGHLDRAAGVAGLIKAICAVHEGFIPPLLGLREPNVDLALMDSPFRVPTIGEQWLTASPRRAGVSSFGVGGTNAHVIVEEFRGPGASMVGTAEPVGPIALPLSAHNEDALAALGCELASTFDDVPVTLDVAHTLAAGRVDRAVRAVVVTSPEAASDALRDLRPVSAPSAAAGSVAVLFPGQGAEVRYEARRLAARYKIFRNEIDEFAGALGVSPGRLLDGVSGAVPEYCEFAHQAALVAVQVALARLAEHCGVVGAAFCGNSVGEYASAYMAGVFDRGSLMAVLAVRDRVMRSAPEGRMLAVMLSAYDVIPLLIRDVDLAGENLQDRVLLSGPPDAIRRQHAVFEERGILARVLPGRVAPHGRLMARVAAEFRQAFDGVRLARTSRPIVSTLTGGWVDPDQLADPEHWVRQMCEPFRFHQAFGALVGSGFNQFVEASPGGALTKLVRAARIGVTGTTLGGELDTDPAKSFLMALGDLWCMGRAVEWDVANGSAQASFTPLPPYPFQRRRFWSHRATDRRERLVTGNRGGLLEFPVWHPQPVGEARGKRTLPRDVVVHGGGSLAAALIDRLDRFGIRVTRSEEVDPQYIAANTMLVDVSHADPPHANFEEPIDAASLRAWIYYGLLSPLEPLRRLRPARLLTVTRGLWSVVPRDRPSTARAGLIGIARCAPHEWPGLRAKIVDLSSMDEGTEDVEAVITELASSQDDDVGYRNAVRYQRCYAPITPSGWSRLRRGGTYLVLGGAGRLGAVVAEAISREVEATIMLVGRDPCRTATAEAERLISVATSRGCDVLRRAARSDDRVQLRNLLDDLTANTGRVDGIFHLAANTDTGAFDLLAEMTAESAAAIAQAKVCTAALLAEELTGRDYDFVALFSSISTVIGATRFGAYVAANAYLDALALVMRERTGRAWYSLVWDGWAADGVAAPNALGYANGAELLLKALRSEHAVVAPVVQPLEQRLAAVRADLATVARAGRETEAADQTSIGEHVLKVVADVTGHTGIDPQQNFASLGIDSLRLMQIAVRIRPILGETVGFGRLLAATSAEELTALAAAAAGVDHSGRTVPAVGEQDLSTPQERMWYLAQLDPGSSRYNVPFGWLVPPYVGAKVRAAVLATLEQHEMLRVAYRQDGDGRPLRNVLSVQDVPITEIELDPADPEASFDRIAREFVEMPFDLTSGSTRVLIASSSDGTRLFFVCHHISIDAWSVKLLWEEIVHRLFGGRGPAGAPRASYRDFVRWEHEMRDGPQFERLAQYWRETLRAVQPTLPPSDTVIVGTGERTVGRATAVLPQEKLDALRSVLREEGATLYAAGLTGLSIALSQWCGLREVVIGSNLANRMREEFESVVGMFVDPVVLRLAPGLEDPTTTLGTALASVRERFTTAIVHTGIPYLDVVRLTGRRGDAGDNPLFSIIATMFDTEVFEAQMASLNVPLPETSKFALAIEFLPQRDGLLVHVLYAADRYLPVTIDRLLERILRYLEALATGGKDLPLSSVFVEQPATPPRERFARRFSQLRGAPTSS